MDKIEAPFSNEQVKSLNDYQQERIFHPFTCDRKSPECETKTNPDDILAEGVLIATTEGWVCPCGKYKQNWAHSFMTGIRLK